MHCKIVGIAALVGLGVVLGQPAIAADISRPVYKAPPPPPPMYRWTGCYVGGHVGGLWANKDWTLAAPDPVTPLGSHNANSWIAGLQAGCDYQFYGGFVIGIQGDYAWTDANGSFVDTVDGVTDQTRIRSLGTVTGRIGYAWDRLLGYVKGGWAWERDNYDRFTIPGGALAGTASETRPGWTIGVGAEYAFTNFLSGFIEYNHYDFGTRTVTFVDAAGAFNDNIDIRERKDVVKVGVNLRWGGGPVYARY